MKGKLLVLLPDNEGHEYVECWINEKRIQGYFYAQENIEDDSINVFFDNQTVTMKRSGDLLAYLADNFPD